MRRRLSCPLLNSLFHLHFFRSQSKWILTCIVLVLVQGNSSEIYQKYFGSAPTAPVIGWLEKLVSSNRAGIVFRCDDPDKNCETQDGMFSLPPLPPPNTLFLALHRSRHHASRQRTSSNRKDGATVLTQTQHGRATTAAPTPQWKPSSVPCRTPPAGHCPKCVPRVFKLPPAK